MNTNAYVSFVRTHVRLFLLSNMYMLPKTKINSILGLVKKIQVLCKSVHRYVLQNEYVESSVKKVYLD